MNRAFAATCAALFTFAAPAAGETISVQVDQAQTIHLPRDAAAVVVGNPLIADVAAHSGRLLFLTGKTFGTTNVIALDSNGDTILAASVDVVGDIDQRLTLHRGRARESFSCVDLCERVPVVGDDTETFDTLTDSNQTAVDAASDQTQPR